MPTCTREDATAVVRRLREAGHVAYFAGGCVRDLLLGQTPKDYDVATDAPPDRVRQLFRNTQAVGAAFGVILVRLGKSTVEVATFRTDGTYTDGRRPDTVIFATAEQDAQRRDFTINGLFLDPLDGDRVIDHVGGRADLDAKLIRAIGNPDERFAEDHLRLLRAVRFAARLGFEIEPETADAIRHHAGELVRVSPERVAEELRRMFGTSGIRNAEADALLREHQLADYAFRAVGVCGDLDSRAAHANTYALWHMTTFGSALAAIAFTWRCWRSGMPDDPAPLFRRVDVATTIQGYRRDLKLSNEEAAEIEGVLVGVGWLLANPQPTLAAKKRFVAAPTSAHALWLLCATGLIVGSERWEKWRSLEISVRQLADTHVAPPPLVTGDDLTAAGATPGPAFKRALDAAYDAQLEDRVTDRAAALALAMDVIRGSPNVPFSPGRVAPG